MAKDMYWVSAAVYALILTIILVNDIRGNRKTGELEHSFWQMLIWVIFFCVQDAFWGLCESSRIPGDGAFFIASTIFHLSTVATTFFWLKYILTYLGDRVHHRRIYLMLDGVVILCQISMVVRNLFTPTIFRIVDGVYVTEKWRNAAFLNQYIVYLIIGFTTLIYAVKETGEDKKRFYSTFSFALAPIISGIFQLLYPDGPFYSIGYFLGCFIVHIFVVSKEREEAARGTIIDSITDIYYSMHLINLEKNVVEHYLESEIITGLTTRFTTPQEMINAVMQGTACSEYLDIAMEFVDLSTLSERLAGRNIISFEFIGKNYGWTRMAFIPVESDKNGKLTKVMVTTQIIDDEKRKQLDLEKRSRYDVLTGLFNRRAYEEDIRKCQDEIMQENFVFLAMDVNGLKYVNDNYGHGAGDELLTGAAECMKKCLGTRGKIYRVGGDEFIAMFHADPEKLEQIKCEFAGIIESWSGKLVDSLAVSCGYVSRSEKNDAAIDEIAALADERMYESKAAYYRQKGNDRRNVRILS